ncbi:MAG: peptidylprolyl isomerase [Kiritimatiellae bacterium]|nr:peptidylprolyl isomerase [Kiritimatiellia bacterium]
MRMMMRQVTWAMGWMALALVFCVGCPKSEKTDAPTASIDAANQDPPPDYVVAMVDETPLTWKEMDARAMGYMKEDIRKNHLMIPTNKLEEAKTYFRKRAISAFVLKTVTLNEATKENIRLSPTDRAESMNALVQALKARNMTTNDFFNNGPLPPAQMRSEFEDGIMIDKLFKMKVGYNLSVSNDEVNAVIATLNATNNIKRAYLEDLRKKIEGGANFEELAKAFSEDEKSRDKGGDIGEFTRGKLHKSLEIPAFSLPVGKLSPVVHSNVGYHILKVTAKMPAVPKTETTPAVPESVRISHIFIRQVPVNRKAIMDTLLAEKFDKAKKAYYKELRDKAKITCFIYPDMVFQ